MPTNPAPTRYHTLDGIRGIAALLVAAYHFSYQFGSPPFPGFLAVDLFFVLSGFVIALNYEGRLAAGLSAAAFMRLRVMRLYPLYLVGWAIGFAKLAARTAASADGAMPAAMLAKAALLNGLVLPIFGGQELFPINGPGWSLFFEFAINLAFALVLFRLRRAALVAISAVALATLGWLVVPPELFNMGWNDATFAGGVARTVFSFCVGILICRNAATNPQRAVTWLCLLPVAGAVLAIALRIHGPAAFWREWSVVAFAFPAIVWFGVRWETPPPLRHAFDGLGALSYPVYIIHIPMIFAGRIALQTLHLPPPLALAAYLAIVVTVAAPLVLLDRRVARFLRGRPAASAPQAT